MKCAVTDETPSLTDWTKFNPATSHPADEPAPAMAQISSHNESLSMVWTQQQLTLTGRDKIQVSKNREFTGVLCAFMRLWLLF